jgi:LPXTG-site transpeptidase (sortase) family protein
MVHKEHHSWLVEVMDFLIVMCVVFLSWVGLMYGQALSETVSDLVYGSVTLVASDYSALPSDTVKQSQVSPRAEALVDTFIDRVVSSDIYLRSQASALSHSYDLSRYLTDERPREHYVFTPLPPGKRLIIPSLGVNVPIVDLAFATPQQIEQGDFTEELKRWVVKYPFTPMPWTQGNSVVFGHSSVEAWNKSPYGFVFYKLQQLEPWARYQVIWDGQLFEYEVVEKIIKKPKDVADVLNSYTNGYYMTLLSCYPLFSDAQRLMVVSKLVQDGGVKVVMK